MLSGDNSILSRAGEARTKTDIAQIEEAIKLEYTNLISTDILNYGNSATVKQAIENIMAKDEYKDRIEKKSGGSGNITLSTNAVIVGATSPNNTATITIEEGSSDGEYYAVSSGKYYKILTDSGDVKIESTPTELSGDDSSSGGGATGVVVADTSKATASLSEDKKTITITGKTAGNTSITVEGINKTANIEVLSSINIADMDLDGAMLLTTTTTSNSGMTSGDENIATITREGVVMCSEKDGDVVIKTSSTEAYKVHSTAKIAKQKNDSKTETFDGQAVGTYNNPTIPAGFYAINTKDAKWVSDTGANVVSSNVNNGLVIMDDKGNQFVWVPVQYINDMVMCENNNKSGHTCNIGFEEETGEFKCLNSGASSDLCGKLYAEGTGETFNSSLTGQQYNSGSGLREVDTVSYDTQEEYKNLIDDKTTMKSEFKKMAKSVAKYGGFYVGRYESSMPGTVSRQIAGANSMTAGSTSQKNWYGLYAKQKTFSTSFVNSYMIWGSQYDAMMRWMQSNGTDVTTESSARTDGTSKNTSRITGATKSGDTAINDKLKNVFDLLGNSVEWTMEAYDTGRRVSRGGYYYNFFSPSYRNYSSPYYTDDLPSSRPTLYLE